MTKPSLLALALLLAACGGSSSGSPDGGPRDGGMQDGGTVVAGGACTAQAQCASGLYCGGTGCGTAGTCQAVPTSCPPDIAQVCGCDGNSYDNSCDAFVAGTRVLTSGACPDAQCTMVITQIQQALGAAQTCSSNSDCVLARPPCGAGPCWQSINNANEATLMPLTVDFHNDSCEASATCSCTFYPDNAICDGGLCGAQ